MTRDFEVHVTGEDLENSNTRNTGVEGYVNYCYHTLKDRELRRRARWLNQQVYEHVFEHVYDILCFLK